VKNFLLFMQAAARPSSGLPLPAVPGREPGHRAPQDRPDPLQHGEHDQRGGIIWHTQGSGKSLTMVFLVRKMRADPQLRRFKVIVVTDRKDLQASSPSPPR
jgi:type I restriction enzyme R subunit